MYKPTGCESLAMNKTIPQIRLLLQGYPGTGKTWGSLTFPNPVVLNLDRGLGAHAGREDVVEVPFWDESFVRTWSKDLAYKSNDLKDKLIKWLEDEGSKLTDEQTLVFDGCTSMQNAYHKWFEANKSRFYTTTGEVNKFAEWDVKKKYYGEVMEIFKRLKCHVIYICHEVDQRDKVAPGQAVSYSGKIRPLLTGGFSDELNSHFTDVFRAHTAEVPADFNALKEEDIIKNWKMTKAEFKAWCTTFPQGSTFYWQTASDSIFDAKASSLVNFPRYIPASFDSFAKFRRKIS